MKDDKYFMSLAILEAQKGRGRTSPNPCVGAIIVKDGEILSKGYHKKAGTPHAEVHALRRAGGQARGATIYVTLEPCNHTGRTPPCSHAIVSSGISRVVIGMEDPNPLVDGTGIQYLQDKGVEVVSGILEQECININLPFIKYITTSLPFVAIKAGVSLDGKITYQEGRGGWLTGKEALTYTHGLRNTYDAILVGVGTLLIDNPSLTTRLPGKEEGRDPIRIIFDTKLRTPLNSQVITQESLAPTWIFCSENVESALFDQVTSLGCRVFKVTEKYGKLVALDVLKILSKEGVTSVLVEGGSTIHGTFLKDKIVDVAHLIYAPIFAGENGISLVSGLSATHRQNAVSLDGVKVERLGADILIEGKVVYPGLNTL